MEFLWESKALQNNFSEGVTAAGLHMYLLKRPLGASFMFWGWSTGFRVRGRGNLSAKNPM